jgi:hypothetical protein
MSKAPGQVTTIVSTKGIAWEYWYGVKSGKRIYLVAPVGSLNTWEFDSVKAVKAFVAQTSTP